MSSLPPHSLQPRVALTAEYPRPALLARLQSALHQQLIIALAPAGFGKTVALHGLWATLAGQRAWLNLGDAGAAGERFVELLVSGAQAAWSLPDSEDRSLSSLLARVGAAQPGLLLIDGMHHLHEPRSFGALAQFCAALPPQAQVLLVCRTLPPLPLALWRSQGRLAVIEHTDFALTAAEWQAFGLSDEGGAAEHWHGWWGAWQARSGVEGVDWDPGLAQWLYEVYFEPLPDDLRQLIGIASLLPSLTCEQLALLCGCSLAEAQSRWAELAQAPAPLTRCGEQLRMASQFRLYLTHAWRRCDGNAWAAAAARGVTALLSRGDSINAASLALESGLPELQRPVAQKAGWWLLYRQQRAVLGRLLDALAATVVQASHEELLLRAAWALEVLKLPHVALRSLEDVADGPIKQALEARAALMFDDIPRAAELAQGALLGFDNDYHPAYIAAEYTLAAAQLALGAPELADGGLRRVLQRSLRDDLPQLQLLALYQRALVAQERGEPELSLRYVGDVAELAKRYHLQGEQTLDSTARLHSQLLLARLETGAAREALQGGKPAANPFGEYWTLPYAVHDAVIDLVDGLSVRAANTLQGIEQRLDEQFYCLKWQNDAFYVQIWVDWLQSRTDRLTRWGLDLQLPPAGAHLHQWRRTVFQAAAALLAGHPAAETTLAALENELKQRGLGELAQQTQLIRALGSGDTGLMREHVRWSAARGYELDYLWLAPKAIAPLEALCGEAELSREPAVLQHARNVLQRLLQPTTLRKSEGNVETAPPAGLTIKEWRVLKLIGQQYTNEQIAARLFVSLATVKTHINHIYGKLAVKTRSEAVHLARTLGANLQ